MHLIMDFLLTIVIVLLRNKNYITCKLCLTKLQFLIKICTICYNTGLERHNNVFFFNSLQFRNTSIVITIATEQQASSRLDKHYEVKLNLVAGEKVS